MLKYTKIPKREFYYKAQNYKEDEGDDEQSLLLSQVLPR